jgi:hypothetical protein
MQGKAMRRLGFVLSIGLAFPVFAKADTILGPDGHLPPGCSRGQYAAAHYRFPLFWRVYARLYIPPVPEAYASDHYREIPPSYYIYGTCCPYENPATLYDYPSLSRSSAPASTGSTKP